MADPDPTPATPSAADDWPARATATVVQYVGTVRDKTTGPALRASRTAVYVAAMGLIGLVAAVLVLVLLIRLLVAGTNELPGIAGGETWLAYIMLGVVFVSAGLFLWRKKEARR